MRLREARGTVRVKYSTVSSILDKYKIALLAWNNWFTTVPAIWPAAC